MCASSLAIHPPRRRRVAGGVLRFVGIVTSGTVSVESGEQDACPAPGIEIAACGRPVSFDDTGEKHGYSFERTTDERRGIDGRRPPQRPANRDADAHAETPAGCGAARRRAASWAR
jgi:hypothetical protein